ncbi:MAG: hypothetical protein FJW37_15195 [Acidobacteria bacterium]|nr:hypothetical protein [Acidobacteriota bacterium]
MTPSAAAVKLPLEEPAGMFTLAGSIRFEFVLVSSTVSPDAGAAGLTKTEQATVSSDTRLAAEQLSPLTRGAPAFVGAVITIVKFFAPLAVAVITRLVSALTCPAVMVNVALREPAGTLTLAGSVRAVLLTARATGSPPVPAGLFRVMVQSALAAAARVAAEQASREIDEPGVRATAKVLAPFAVAVIVALAAALTAPAVAVKLAIVAPAGTVTLAGTLSKLLLLLRATVVPPLPAADPSVTVQAAAPPDPRFAGVQESWEMAAPSVTAAVFETPFQVAVMVAVPAEVKEPTVIEKLAVLAPAASGADAGAVTAGWLLEMLTGGSPACAAPESVAVQFAGPAAEKDDGVQTSEIRLTTAEVGIETLGADREPESPFAEVVANPAQFIVIKVGAVGERVTVATAINPPGIGLRLFPITRQVYPVTAPAHSTVFWAETAAPAAATLTLVTSLDENTSLN